jgi:hypothetical protein
MYKTLGFKWFCQVLCPASAFATADRDEARNPQHFIHVSVMLNFNTKIQTTEMIKALLLVLLGLTFHACHERIEPDLRKEVFDFILKDRIKLNSTIHIIRDSNDSIRIFNLTLIEDSYNELVMDSTKNRIRIFSYNTPSYSHSFFGNSKDSILKRIQRLESRPWDTTSLNIDIKIDSPNNEYGDTIKNKTALWIQNNLVDKSFLQISEPLFNINGEVLVATKISTNDYVIDKYYILKRNGDNWVTIKQDALVGKYTDYEFGEIIKPDGTKVPFGKRNLIVIGYFDL